MIFFEIFFRTWNISCLQPHFFQYEKENTSFHDMYKAIVEYLFAALFMRFDRFDADM